MESNDAAGRIFWENAWSGYRPQIYTGPVYEFHELYKKYLPFDKTKTVLEVGAMPGNHLVYFAKEFGYKVSGLDYCADLTPIYQTLEANQIDGFSVMKADFFTMSNDVKYDVVFSSGFVEHFEDYQGVLALHASLVKPGGYLLITIPNVKYLHKHLMKLFCPDIYEVHRDYLIDKKLLAFLVSKLGFNIYHCDFLITFRPFYPVPKWFGLMNRIVNKVLRIFKLNDIPNKYASPYLYLIARKVD